MAGSSAESEYLGRHQIAASEMSKRTRKLLTFGRVRRTLIRDDSLAPISAGHQRHLFRRQTYNRGLR